MLRRTFMIICFIAGQIRKKSLHKMSYYPEQIVIAGTKKKLNQTCPIMQQICQYNRKIGLSGIKSKADNLYIEKPKSARTYLSWLSDVVDNDFIKTSFYDKEVNSKN